MIQRYTWKEFQKIVIKKMFPDAELLRVMKDYDSSDGGVQETYEVIGNIHEERSKK